MVAIFVMSVKAAVQDSRQHIQGEGLPKLVVWYFSCKSMLNRMVDDIFPHKGEFKFF